MVANEKILISSLFYSEDKIGYHMTHTALRALSFAKPLIKVPYEGCTHLRERGQKKAALLQKRTASRFKT